uniref:Uncharacterized protein n=1 Tax=Tanacetum cinerariifolium TaxID=118510 RepID=A0A6L2NBP0_TANCI|nr:hypothetical protein [Tanacetum cinerariifolium]
MVADEGDGVDVDGVDVVMIMVLKMVEMLAVRSGCGDSHGGEWRLEMMTMRGWCRSVTKTIDGKETVIPPTSVEEKAQRRAELKAKSTLLMALPNENQLKFNSYTNAKTLM